MNRLSSKRPVTRSADTIALLVSVGDTLNRSQIDMSSFANARLGYPGEQNVVVQKPPSLVLMFTLVTWHGKTNDRQFGSRADEYFHFLDDGRPTASLICKLYSCARQNSFFSLERGVQIWYMKWLSSRQRIEIKHAVQTKVSIATTHHVTLHHTLDEKKLFRFVQRKT